MSRVRQLYIYGVCAVSLLFLATGVENLIRLLIQVAAGFEATPWLWLSRGALRQQMSFFVALTAINVPVWIGHWLAANRDLGETERASPIRRLYLYLALAGALLFFVPGAIGLIRTPIWALLGAPIAQPLVSAVAAPIGLILVTVPIWLYHRRLALSDAALAGDAGALATIRRLYFYAASFILVNFLLVNLARLGTSFWEGMIRILRATTVGDWAWASASLPSLGAATAVLLALWWWHWATAEEIAARPDEIGLDERRSRLRLLTLYLHVLVFLIVAAVNLSTVLNDLFRAALGSPDPAGNGRNLVDALGQPIVWGIAYGAFWLYHRWWLQREANRAAEASDQAALRRLYYYLVAAVGLTIFTVGLILLLTTILSVPSIRPDQFATDWFRSRVSVAATLTVVGYPIWLGHWVHQQRLAADPAIARAERAALWRRTYLYAALFATVVAVLVEAASALYQILLAALGETPLPSLLENVRTPLSVIVVTAVILFYHVRVLRNDFAAGVGTTTPLGPALAVVLVRATNADALDRALEQVSGLSGEGAETTIIREPSLERQLAEHLAKWRER